MKLSNKQTLVSVKEVSRDKIGSLRNLTYSTVLMNMTCYILLRSYLGVGGRYKTISKLKENILDIFGRLLRRQGYRLADMKLVGGGCE